MVQRCCVPFCETKVGDSDVNGVKVRFHRMPMTPEKFQQWRARITNFGQYNPEPDLTVNSRICSKHFLKQDYVDNCQKPITGNHILTKNASPSRFRWSSENCDVSAAVPFVRRIKPQQSTHNVYQTQQHAPPTFPKCFRADGICITHSPFEKQTQCSFEDERLKNEISRKNSIIQQLLERISQLETEHKTTTQLLLKESLQGGPSSSVIRSTSPNIPRRDHIKDTRDLTNHQSSSVIIQNNQYNSVISHGGSAVNNSRKRKLQETEEDENIHYVLLSLSEKVVRHDIGSPGT